MRFMAGGVAVLLVAAGCGESRVPTLEPPSAPTEPLVIGVDTPGFTGEIRLEPSVASTTVLRDALEPDLRAQMVEATVAARADAEARGPDAGPGAYFYRSTWDGTAVGTRYLSVVGETATFTGGALALLAIDAFVWDRMTERRLELQDLLADPTPGGEALQELAMAVREALVAAKRAKAPDYDPASDGFL
jgi:hypothetical protein